MSERNYSITDFVNGDINSNGVFIESSNRLRSDFIFPKGKSFVSVTINEILTTDVPLQVGLAGVGSSGQVTRTYSWLVNGDVADMTGEDIEKFVVIVRKSDNSSITPSDVSVVSMNISVVDYTWVMESTGPTNTDFPDIQSKSVSRPYPKGYWRIGSDGLPHTDLFPLVGEIPIPDPYNNTDYHNYQIYADDLLIFDTRSPMDELKLIDPQLHLEDNSAGSLEFTIPYTNLGYDDTITQPMKTEIFVYEDGRELWSGRILTEERDFYNRRKLYCEGELAYLNDTCQPQREYNMMTLRQFLGAVLDIHNSKVDENKAFHIGIVDQDLDTGDPLDYRYTQYQKTMEVINDLLETYGGHLSIRKSDGIRYLDWRKDYNAVSPQRIIFGENLVDFTKSFDFSELATVLVPLGERIDQGERSTVGDVLAPDLYFPHCYIDPEDYNVYDTTDNNYAVMEYNIEAGKTYFITTRMNEGRCMYVIKDEDDIIITHKDASSGVDMTDIIEEKVEAPAGSAKLFVGGFVKHVEIRVNNEIELSPELDEYTTIESVNGGSIYLVNEQTRKTYGWLEKQVTFEGVTDPQQLKNMANEYLTEGQFDGMSMQVSAFDMVLLGADTRRIRLLDQVYVESPPHGLYSLFPVSALDIPLSSPQDAQYTMGKEGEKTLTGVNNNVNEDLLREIMRQPSISSVIQSAIDNATQMITSATSGFVTIRQGEDDQGNPIAEEILITDTADYLESTKCWRWNLNGFAYSGNGYEGPFETAITMDGTILGKFIAAGTIYADRIKGGTLTLGGIDGANGDMQVISSDGHSVVCRINNTGVWTMNSNYWNRVADGSFTAGAYEDGNMVQYGQIFASSRIDVGGTLYKGLELASDMTVITSKKLAVRETTSDTVIPVPTDVEIRNVVTDLELNADGTVSSYLPLTLVFKNGILTTVTQ